MKFLVKYALAGGFGGCERQDGEIIDVKDEEAASDYAWEMACQEYESYDGMHGLRNVEMIMEEDDIENEDEAYEVWEEEREGWLDYSVEKVKE